MRFLVWTCALTLACNLSVHALSISPTRIVIDEDKGAQVAIRFAAENEPVPLELTILERLPGGAFEGVPESTMRAFPPQLLLEAGQPRSVVIEVSGSIAADAGRSFYIRVEQLGLRTGQGDAGSDREIVLLTTYLLPVHVTGGHAGALTAGLVPLAEGAQVSLMNDGTGPALLSGCSLKLIGHSGTESEIDGRWLAEQIGADAVLPGETVTLALNALISFTQTHSETAPVAIRAACDPS